MFLRVYSFDSWDRHVLEGYGFADLPSRPGNLFLPYLELILSWIGTHDLSITTWRPFGDRVTRLKSFFIGGSTELEDIEFINDLHLGDVRIVEY
jgi:Meckel syndrome type 1 protein